MVFTQYKSPTSTFNEKHRAVYNEEPAMSADEAYDSLYLYKNAIERAKTFDVDTVKAEILKVSFEGASGNVTLDKDGAVQRKPILYQLKEGRKQELNP
jgi:branched-chain amino acid transport system substrate-binding protein